MLGGPSPGSIIERQVAEALPQSPLRPLWIKIPQTANYPRTLEARSSGSNKGRMDCCVVSTNLLALWS